jgi:PRTRC genetic system protein E
MNKVNFFTELSALMQDKESIDLKIQKTGDELTVLLVPKIKGKTATITMSGSAEDLNEGFMSELLKPIEKINGLVSTASEVEIKDAEEDDNEEEAEEKKPEAKKSAPKKAATKKVDVVKSEDETPTITIDDKSTDEIEAEIEKERIEAEEAERLASEQVEKEKAEQEAKEVELKEEFNHLIKLGDESLNARQYEEAEINYQKASKLFPDNKEVYEKFIKAQKWVSQLIAAGILPERKEVENANS